MKQLLGTSDGDTPTQHVLVVGGARTGLALAEALADDDTLVTFVGDLDDWVESDVRTVRRHITCGATLSALLETVEDVDAVVAAGPDSHALLVSELAVLDDPDRPAVALIDDPSLRAAFDDLDVELLETPALLASELRTVVRSSTKA